MIQNTDETTQQNQNFDKLLQGCLKDPEYKVLDSEAESLKQQVKKMKEQEETPKLKKSKLEEVEDAGNKWEAEIAKMHMICLLYTSPSPRDKRQSRMPSSA